MTDLKKENEDVKNMDEDVKNMELPEDVIVLQETVEKLKKDLKNQKKYSAGLKTKILKLEKSLKEKPKSGVVHYHD